MTDEELEAIRARHEDFARVIIWSPRGHAEDAHADRATLLRALDAERARVAELEAALKAIAKKQSATTATEAADRMQFIARATLAKETP